MNDDKNANIKKKIVKICKRLHKKNMLAAADGNVSYRVSDDEIYITPSGVVKAYMKPEEMACIKLNGEVISGNPSSERQMHLEVFRKCSQAKAVIHAHPPHAIAWTVARPELKELPAEAMSELILACGKIPIVPFAMPGTLGMGTNLHPFLPKCRVLVLARHGGLCWGEDLDEVHRGMERLEHSAQILVLANSLGGITKLDDDNVELLKELRQEITNKSGNIVL